MGNLWGVCCEYCGENWCCSDGPSMETLNGESRFCLPTTAVADETWTHQLGSGWKNSVNKNVALCYCSPHKSAWRAQLVLWLGRQDSFVLDWIKYNYMLSQFRLATLQRWQKENAALQRILLDGWRIWLMWNAIYGVCWIHKTQSYNNADPPF